MTKKGRQFFQEKNRVTPSVAATGDTNPSDATGYTHEKKHRKPDSVRNLLALMESDSSETHKLNNILRIEPVGLTVDGGHANFQICLLLKYFYAAFMCREREISLAK